MAENEGPISGAFGEKPDLKKIRVCKAGKRLNILTNDSSMVLVHAY
jgi:hypothetical protein